MLPQQRDCFRDFLRIARVREYDAACILHLIEEKFAEIFEIHLALLGVHYAAESVELRALYSGALYGADDVGQLSDARRLDDDAVGGILCRDLPERLCKIAHERAADTAGIHLGDLDSGIL